MNVKQFTNKNIRTVWVRNWCDEFLKELIKHEEKETIEKYCLTKKEEFIQICKDKSLEQAKKQEKELDDNSWKNTAASRMSGVRKAIKAWQQWMIDHDKLVLTPTNSSLQVTKEGTVNNHLALIFMNFDKDFHKERVAPQKDKKNEQRRQLQSINCVDEYQAKIEEVLNSSDYRKLAAGLIAASGRRPSEIFKTAQFTQVGQFEIEFSGQLKAKGKTEAYRIYTLVESHKVVDGLLRLRRMTPVKLLRYKTLEQIDSGRNMRLNTKIVEAFGDLISPPHGELRLSAKNLRAIYASVAIYLFCDWKQSPQLFITEHLGHANDGVASNYEDYQVVNKMGKPLTRGAWVSRLDEEMKPTTQTVTNARLRLTKRAVNVLADQEFLPFPDAPSRMEELIRLAELGKAWEAGELDEEPIEVAPIEDNNYSPFTRMSNQELLGSKAPNSTSEKLRRAVEAIKKYNENKPQITDKWMINSSTLSQLTNVRSSAITKFLNSEEGRLLVADYNQMWGLGYHHNRGKGSIKKVISLL